MPGTPCPFPQRGNNQQDEVGEWGLGGWDRVSNYDSAEEPPSVWVLCDGQAGGRALGNRVVL